MATLQAEPVPTDRANWTLADWQRYDSEGLQAMIAVDTPEWHRLHSQATNGAGGLALVRSERHPKLQ